MRAGVREEDKGHDFFPPSVSPPFFFLFLGECTMLDGLGRPWSWASWIGVERLYRIMMGAGWEGPWSPARSRPSAKAAYVLLVGTMSPELFTRRGWANNIANVHCRSRSIALLDVNLPKSRDSCSSVSARLL